MTKAEAIQHFIGPAPSRWRIFYWLDWRFCAHYIQRLWAGSPRFIVFRCSSCHKLMSASRPCCGGQFKPVPPSTWKLFVVWLRER